MSTLEVELLDIAKMLTDRVTVGVEIDKAIVDQLESLEMRFAQLQKRVEMLEGLSG